MLGGGNGDSLVPGFGHPVHYDHNNSHPFRPSKRQREVDDIFMQKKVQVSLNHNFYVDDFDQPLSILNPHHVSTGLKLSYDDEERNSSITSASASMALAPSIMPSIGASITTELDQHKEEFERFIMIQEENMLKGIREISQRHITCLLATIEKGVETKLHEKQVEIENINCKNKELVERIKEVATEAQNWHYRAKYNESVVNLLKVNLQQAMALGNENRFREGFGETDIEVSSNGLNDNVGKSSCKSCRENEVSVLVMPCRHLCLCKDCDGFTSVCPVCQMVKVVSMEVYLL